MVPQNPGAPRSITSMSSSHSDSDHAHEPHHPTVPTSYSSIVLELRSSSADLRMRPMAGGPGRGLVGSAGRESGWSPVGSRSGGGRERRRRGYFGPVDRRRAALSGEARNIRPAAANRRLPRAAGHYQSAGIYTERAGERGEREGEGRETGSSGLSSGQVDTAEGKRAEEYHTRRWQPGRALTVTVGKGRYDGLLRSEEVDVAPVVI